MSHSWQAIEKESTLGMYSRKGAREITRRRGEIHQRHQG